MSDLQERSCTEYLDTGKVYVQVSDDCTEWKLTAKSDSYQNMKATGEDVARFTFAFLRQCQRGCILTGEDAVPYTPERYEEILGALRRFVDDCQF